MAIKMFSKTSLLLLVIALFLVAISTIGVGLYLDSQKETQAAQTQDTPPNTQVVETTQTTTKESNLGEKPEGEGWVIDENYIYTKDCRIEVIDKWSVFPEDTSNEIAPHYSYFDDVGYCERVVYHGPPVKIVIQYEIEEGFTTQTFLGLRFVPAVVTDGYIFTVKIQPIKADNDVGHNQLINRESIVYDSINLLEQKGVTYLFQKPPDNWQTSCIVYSKASEYTKNCRVEVISKNGIYPGNDSRRDGMITYLYVLGYAQNGIYHGPPAIIKIQYTSKDGHIMESQYGRVVTEGQDFPAHIATTDPEYIKLLEQKGITYTFHQPPDDWQTSINVTLKENN